MTKITNRLSVAHAFRVDLFNESFETRHPAGSEMTVLKEHPLTTLHRQLHHLLRDWTLSTTRSVILVH